MSGKISEHGPFFYPYFLVLFSFYGFLVIFTVDIGFSVFTPNPNFTGNFTNPGQYLRTWAEIEKSEMIRG